MIYFGLFDTDEGYHIKSQCHVDNETVMQFTGLLDRNGKEIYEGDIVTHMSVVENRKHGSPQDNFGAQEIDGIVINVNRNPYPIHRDFMFNPYRVVEVIGATFFPLASYGERELEIIGNIYEHPDLLKKEA